MSYLPLYGQYLQGIAESPNTEGEVYAQCCFHDDTDPSFSFNDVTGLWYCFKCKEGGDAPKFIMMAEGVSFSEARQRVAELLGNPTLPATEEITAWKNKLWNSPTTIAYLERRGLTDQKLLLHYNLGFDGERLTLPIYSASGELKNVRRLRLPEGSGDKAYNWRGFGKALLWPEEQLAAESLLLCAGEIDCLTALQQGYNAITGTGGEGVWHKEWSELFRDKAVYIAYDGDDTGRKMGRHIATSLQGIAREIRVLQIPDGEDINSLHQKGQSLREFIDKAPVVGAFGPRILTFQELQKEAAQEAKLPWIVEGLLRPGWLAVLAGHAKRGKTTLLAHLAVAISSNEQFLGRATTSVPVLYMNYEMANQTLVEMLESISADRGPLQMLTMVDPPRPLTPEALLTYLGSEPGLAIIDSAIAAFMFRGDDENSSGEVGYYLRGLLSLARQTGWSFMVIHHLVKHGNSPAGSREWTAAPDVIWMWDKPNKKSEIGVFSVEGRIPPTEDLKVRMNWSDCTILGEVLDDADDLQKIEMVRRYLRGFPGETVANIATATELPKSTVHRILRLGEFRREGQGTSRHDPYRWYAKGEDE